MREDMRRPRNWVDEERRVIARYRADAAKVIRAHPDSAAEPHKEAVRRMADLDAEHEALNAAHRLGTPYKVRRFHFLSEETSGAQDPARGPLFVPQTQTIDPDSLDWGRD